LAELGPGEWRALADGVVAAVCVEVGLRTRPLAQVIGWAESRVSRASHDDVDPQRLVVLSAWPYRAIGLSPSCLRRSLVLTVLLRQRRLPAICCLGVRRDAGELRAHAWVDCGTGPLDAAAGDFQRLQPSSAIQLTRNARWHP
jgi:hypothetical protein